MKSLTKLLITLFGLFSILGFCLAQSTSSSSGYNAPITDSSLNFSATLKDGKVYTSWNVFTKEPLKRYKVMRSTTNPYPVYPEDSYVKAIGDMNTTSFTDYSPKSAYYRVCAITQYNNRYCSKVVKITVTADTYDKYAGYEKSSGYTTIPDNAMNFAAKLYNGKVYTSWNKYSHGESFKYYKVIRSATNSNPVYPDHGYIKAIGNIAETAHVDANPLVGYAYYRVCSITEGYLRYCSNVIKVYNAGNSDEGNNNADNSDDYSDNNAINLSQDIKDRLDSIIENFIEKLEAKYSENSDRAEYIDKVINNLESLLEKKPRLKNIINYLIDLLTAKRDAYDNGLDEIEGIFDVE